MKTPALPHLFLPLALAGLLPAAQDDQILGRPSAIQPSTQEQSTLFLEAGSRLYEQPTTESSVLEILPAALELPVLDRQGSWVKIRFGNWQGWVQPGGQDPKTSPMLLSSIEPDDERLLRARSLLGESIEPRSLGPFTLYTDVLDEDLLVWLAAVAEEVPRAYRERFDLDPGAERREVLVIFAKEAEYRRFEAAEARIAQADSRGYTSEGLSVLFMGDHSRTSQVAVFIHELTHLLNRLVFHSETPPWLEEGMAEDLAFNRVTGQGEIRLGTLAGVARQGTEDRYALSEPRAHLQALVSSWTSPNRLDLESLVVLDWDEFIQPHDRVLRYAASAMFLRYLLDGGDEALRQDFRRFLSETAAAELAQSISLWEVLDARPEELEEGLYRFVRTQATKSGIR